MAYFPFAMDREQLDQWCERGILGLVIAILAWGPLSAGAVLPLEFLVLQGLAVALIGVWIVRLWVRPSHRLLWAPISWGVIAFTAYAILRYHQAEIEFVARGELIRIIIYAVLFFVIVDNLHRQESTQVLGFVLIFLAMAISIYAVYEFATGTPIVWHFLGAERKPDQYLSRGSGTYICPNNLAGFLEMILPLGVAFTLVGRFSPTVKVFLGYASLVMMAGLGVTLSRGGWLSAGLALLVMFVVLLGMRGRRLPAILFVALVIGCGAFFFNQTYHAQQRWDDLFREHADIRFHLWKPALEMWQDHFLWGAGPGHFDYRFPFYRPEVVQLRPGHVHNDYLNTLADYGLVGGLLVAVTLGLFLWGITKTWRFVKRSGELVSKPSGRASVVLGGAIGLLAVALHSIVDFNMQVPGNALIAVGLLAMVTGYLRYSTEGYWVSSTWLIRICLTLVCLVAVVFMSCEGLKRYREVRVLQEANAVRTKVDQQTMDYARAMEQLAERADGNLILQLSGEIQAGLEREIELLKRAYEIEPANFETAYRVGRLLQDFSFQGEANYVQMAEEAIEWYARASRANPYDSYNYMRSGMCLDWVGRHADARRFFDKAIRLDPSSFFVVAHYGVHLFYSGELDKAKVWLRKSLRLSDWRANHIAHAFLTQIALKERAKAQGAP